MAIGSRWAQISAILLVMLVATSIALRKARWPVLGLLFGSSHAVFGQQQPTIVHVGPQIVREHVKRLGINLGGHTFYDSGQIMQNLLYRNPGFEGDEWQSIIQCGRTTSNTCTDTVNSDWPAGFWDGASFEVIVGSARGQTGTIAHSSAADRSTNSGITVQFDPSSKAPAVKDYVVLRKHGAGGALVGWGQYVNGGATIAGETTDLSPLTRGIQAIRVAAAGPGQFAALKQDFDSLPDHTFVQLRGPYLLKFRAKKVSGSLPISVQLTRLTSAGNQKIFEKSVTLSNSWQDYTIPFLADEIGNITGTLEFQFSISQVEVLIDDVSLQSATSNGTAFRTPVVDALQALHPGVLRYMDAGQNFGSTLDNVLAVESARQRSGFSKYFTQADDIPIGLHDFLVLCEKLGAEPWYAVQAGWSEQDARNLIEYLAGPVNTPYGAKRAALGHPVPWTDTFPVIHLEYGNEMWNGIFQGAAIEDPEAYANRATTIFHAMRASPAYSPSHFDLIADGFAVNTYWNQKVVENGDGFDTIDVAPYLFATFADDSSTENIFGPMFAEPEMLTASKGVIRQQADIAAHARHPVNLAVYETNIGTMDGTVGQRSLDQTVPSIGAGITVVENMLLMLRDLGVATQNVYELPGYQFQFNNTATHQKGETSALWGTVVDMGVTDRRRPSYLAEQLANQVIRASMLQTVIAGDNPTWDQPLSANAKIQLKDAHELQTFAFTDGKTDTLVLFNLSRTQPRTLTLDGPNAPQGTVNVRTLTSAKITDSNELEDTVKIVDSVDQAVVRAKTTFSLPPFSMTTLSSPH